MNPAFVMPFARLQEWAARTRLAAPDIGVTIPPARLDACPTMGFPPCLACGRKVTEQEPPALSIDLAERTATFGPCGCVVTVPDMPTAETAAAL